MGRPRISFGVIADIQYADIADGLNFTKDKVRHYRNSLHILSAAVKQWSASKHKISFVLQLGDIIDGQNARTPRESEKALDKVMDVFKKLDCPVYHVIGNHELYNFKRDTLKHTKLNARYLPSVHQPHNDLGNYYDFSPSEGFRVVVLDTYDKSLVGLETSSLCYQETLAFFRQYNQNEEPNDPSGLPDKHAMYAAYNGAVSDKQLKWLDKTLCQAEKNNEKVIVAGHDPVYEGSAIRQCLAWNHESIVSVFQHHKSCLVGYLAGHDHSGGHAKDEMGISYITLPGVVDAKVEESCHGVMHVFEDRFELEGFGVVPSYTLPFES